jgi:hypothetical protein
MKKHVIFLDIDGVLVSYADLKLIDEYGQQFVPSAVDALNKLIECLDSDVCISSSWRVGSSVEELQHIMDIRGVKCKIVGMTPHFGERGLEILAWLEKHPEYEKFLVIDDEHSDIIPHIGFHWKKMIKTNCYRCLDLYDIAMFDRDKFFPQLLNWQNRTKTHFK